MPHGQDHSKRSHDQYLGSKAVRAQLRNRDHNLSKSTTAKKIGTQSTFAREDQELLSSSVPGTTECKDEHLTYYPAYCHKASPTWFEWVKLTAYDIHTKLHVQDGYQHSWLTEYRFARDAPQLMFYLNHPIQFVQIVGVVVSFDEYFDRFWLFTIDDSSGLTIDIVCKKPSKEKPEAVQPSVRSEDEKDEEKEIAQMSNLVMRTVELGSVLQVKGVVTLFRRGGFNGGMNDLRTNARPNPAAQEEPVRQISLQRLSKVHDTNQEISLIAARTQFYKSVLAQPWVVSQKEQDKLHKEALGEVEHDRKRAKRAVRRRQQLIEQEKEDAEKIQQEYKNEEEERARDAEAAREAGERLKIKLERQRTHRADEALPKADRFSGDTKPGKLKDRARRIRHMQGQDVIETGRVNSALGPDQPDTANDSFGPLEDSTLR